MECGRANTGTSASNKMDYEQSVMFSTLLAKITLLSLERKVCSSFFNNKNKKNKNSEAKVNKLEINIYAPGGMRAVFTPLLYCISVTAVKLAQVKN